MTSRLTEILKRLVDDSGLRAVLLVDKSGNCLASHGDGPSMEAVAETHFSEGLSLGNVCRDADGSTVLSTTSTHIVRFESVAGGRCILTLVSDDPLAASHRRATINRAKEELTRVLVELEARP